GASHTRQGATGGKRVVIFENPAVAGVGDVEVAAGVHRHPNGGGEADGAHPAIVGGGRDKIGLPDHQVGRTAVDKGGYVLPAQHAVVVAVCHVEPVGGHAGVDRDRPWAI